MGNSRSETIPVRCFLLMLIVGHIPTSRGLTVPNKDDRFTVNVTMTNFEINEDDLYAYVQYKLPDEELTVVGFSPLIDMNSAHHMLTYACEKPGTTKPFWVAGGTCQGEQMIIHGWGRNAPAMNLPEDVGFAVGRNTPFKYIVVNIHYFSKMKNDNSGNQLILSRTPRKYRAGVMLSGTGEIYLRPKAEMVRTPFSCQYDGPSISIFAARVHAHQWGRVNSLYRVRDGEITQIVKGDPQWPQSFYPLPSPIDVQAGDYIVGQCVYDNTEDRVIHVGATHNDEMCNVYAMYSYKPSRNSNDPPPAQMCWDNRFNKMATLIPLDSIVPPLKPTEMGAVKSGHHAHAEHAMVPSAAKDLSDEDQSYEDYIDEVENMRHREKDSDEIETKAILAHLGLPDYEYVDAQSYDHLLPQHLTYGEEQTVKLHNAKRMSSALYANVENWPEVKSLPSELGEIGGIALSNNNNELVVFHRGSRRWEFKYFDGYRFQNDRYGPIKEDVLLHVDTRTGQTKYRWGANMFYMPHGLTIDHDGNFWVTDVAMHQVFMFKPNELTRPALIVGDMFQAGSGPSQLCRPADVAVAKNGDFFIADGYCNSRIVKFNRKGEYIMEWGSEMTGRRDADGFPLPNEWNIVHSIALNEEAQLVCGADRENFRIQCFDSNTGAFQRQIRVEQKTAIGAIYAIDFAPNTNGTVLFAVTGGAQTPTKKVYMINAQTGDILTSFDSNPPLDAPHDIAVSSNGREIYVGELAVKPANALHKFEMSTRKDLPTQTYSRRAYFSDKNFRVSALIMVAFALPVLVAVVVGCCIRMRNMRKLHRLNAFLIDVKHGNASRGTVLDTWMNRRKGFERLEQYSDGENEPLDSNMGDDSSDEASANVGKQARPISANRTGGNAFRMNESL